MGPAVLTLLQDRHWGAQPLEQSGTVGYPSCSWMLEWEDWVSGILEHQGGITGRSLGQIVPFPPVLGPLQQMPPLFPGTLRSSNTSSPSSWTYCVCPWQQGA